MPQVAGDGLPISHRESGWSPRMHRGGATAREADLLSLRSFLTTLGPLVDYAVSVRQELDRRLATQFSLFTYLRKDELGLSHILADLLSPTGTHGQGEIFLRDLLRRVGLGDADARGARVTREAPLSRIDERGQIDILIEGHDWVLGIENKPRAVDQPTQLQRYWKELRHARDPSQARLIYLSGNGEPPDEASICRSSREQLVEEGKLFLFGFAPADGEEGSGSLLQVIEHWARLAEAPRVRAFLEELAFFIRSHFAEPRKIMDNPASNALADAVLAGPATAWPALMLIEALPTIRARLLNGVTERIRELVKARLPGLGMEPFRWEPELGGPARGYREVLVGRPWKGLPWPAQWWVGLVAEGPLAKASIGIHAPGWQKAGQASGLPAPVDKDALDACRHHLVDAERATPHWPVWRYLDELGPELYAPAALQRVYLAVHPEGARGQEIAPDLGRIADDIAALARGLDRALGGGAALGEG